VRVKDIRPDCKPPLSEVEIFAVVVGEPWMNPFDMGCRVIQTLTGRKVDGDINLIHFPVETICVVGEHE